MVVIFSLYTYNRVEGRFTTDIINSDKLLIENL